jgi:hypothetical protein
MPRFPKKEADIAALAEPLWSGLLSNRPVYPKPPIHPMVLRMKSLVYKNRCEVLLAKKANAETATTAKNDALENLVKALKSNILYAENTVNFDDAKLKLIGWAGRNITSEVAATVINIVVLAVAYPRAPHFLGYEKYGVWLVLATVLTFA